MPLTPPRNPLRVQCTVCDRVLKPNAFGDLPTHLNPAKQETCDGDDYTVLGDEQLT